ncbi:SGNH/GDSL hydrolase family protein [Mucilaginibacter psychrotolerans]|uniref:SGNH/GDSL hydrolase family protein n=1 Tax=Mucilaginibacter psychrotolerans TaxID=1524096 RepID=A0A4Y8SJ69_9SPHI|nr:SGNH/GDSL hydrolase family protein [Mucilaginibacter psychrotolerans]TFF39133.1 SGNH/GDSL hydrolase family protein [Mucilaginibacter psychrotolerans]
MLKYFYLLLVLSGFALPLSAQQTQTADLKWKGFERVNFTIDGHPAYYVKPNKPLPGNPWVWRSSFPDWHTDADSILLSRGMYVAYVDVDNQYGSPQAMQVWDEFYAYLQRNAAFSTKAALEAVSRGGLYAYAWAKRNPDKVSCIYGETPVCDIKSWPGGKGAGMGDTTSWAQYKQVFGFTEAQAMAFKDNPIDNLEGLAAFHVPLLHYISNADKLVPVAENSNVLVKNYKALGGQATEVVIDKQPQELFGHHFIIEHPEAIADFLMSNAYPVKPVLPYGDYFKLRGGLNKSHYVIKQDKQATVAFLGGSITFNPGWRDKITTYLKATFPETKFRFIAAGIPSLGSLPHVFRLQRDLLDSGKIDLLFIEAAVNDRVNGTDSLTQVRDLEGIVLHAKRTNPRIDILMMSFADPDKNKDYASGKIPVEIINHELVASRYDLPSINIAKEVYDKIQNKEFDWDKDFKDLHPAPFGQELYFATIKALLQVAMDPGVPLRKYMPRIKRLNSASFANGNYYSINNARYDADWSINPNWTPTDGLGTRPGFVNIPVLSAYKPGAELTLNFTGRAIGMAIVSGGDAGTVSYVIDGKAYKPIDLYTQWSGFLHLPWYILFDGNLKPGKHVLKLKIAGTHAPASKGYACRIVNFLRSE